MTDAMAQLRAELGPDAVILATRRVPEGIEITAALETAEPVMILPDVPADSRPSGLHRHNLPRALADRLGNGGLAEALAATLDFTALPDPKVRPLLLIGPPGAGKTTTCAKLAARLVLDGIVPLIVTTDGARAGAAEQLAAFTRVLGAPLAVAPTPGTLLKALMRRPPGQPVLIDTAGIDPFDPGQAEAVRALIEVGDAAAVLVLPAGLDACESAELAAAFRQLGAPHLIPTRLDLARRLGGVITAAVAGLALTEAGTGPGAAADLTPITPEWLAARLLGSAETVP